MSHVTLLAIIYLAFVSLGLPDSVLGVAWPAMRLTFAQPLQSAGLVAFILTLCSAISGFASAAVLRRLSVGVVVTISGCLTGCALLGFALAPSFTWILLLTVPLGLGAGAVDAGLNHFVAEHYSSRHMNWLHGCWGIGATIGPFIMGSALAGAAGWQSGYRTIAVIQLALSLLFLLTLGLWKREHAVPAPEADKAAGRVLPDAFVSWAPWLAPCLYLVYATVEIGTALWAASILVEHRHLDAPTAGVWVACFFGAIMVGRFAVGLVALRLGNRKLVRYGLLVALAGAVLFSLDGLAAASSLGGLILMGLGCAPIYPSLMHETTLRFDPDTARTVVGRQVAFAYVGASLGPAGLGLLGARFGLGSIMPTVVVGLVLLLLLSWWLDRVT
jgi:fucose permease